MPKQSNREAWLTQAVEAMRPLFRQQGKRIPEYNVSCGWPARRGTANKNRCIGECWTAHEKRKINQIYISPILDQPIEVLETLAHEVAHAVLPHKTGHKKPFAQLAKNLGLEGKPTATHAGDELRGRLGEISDELGPYPHEKVDLSGFAKQPTRLIKGICPDCGYTIRLTSKWIEHGMPICTCGTQMVEDDGEIEVQKLNMIETNIEYGTKSNRFSVRFQRNRKAQSWFLIDWEVNRMATMESREDALDTIDAIEVGLTNMEQLQPDLDDQDAPNEDQVGFNPDDTEDVIWLDDEEEEVPDYPEDQFVSAEEEAEYDGVRDKREGWAEKHFARYQEA